MQLRPDVAVRAFALLALAATLSACTTAPRPTENTLGGYLVPANSPYYKAEGGVLYATDGTDWFALRAAEHSAGYIGGADVGTVERWVKVGGSEVQSYRRSPATFRDQSLRPVFLPY